jgi:hypothetical protein
MPKNGPFSRFLSEKRNFPVLHIGVQSPSIPTVCIYPLVPNHTSPDHLCIYRLGCKSAPQISLVYTHWSTNRPTIFLRSYILGCKFHSQKTWSYILGRNLPQTTHFVYTDRVPNISLVYTHWGANQAPNFAWSYILGRNRPEITPKCFTHWVENCPQAAIGMALLMGLQERQAFASPPCSHPPHSIPFRERSIVLPTLHA